MTGTSGLLASRMSDAGWRGIRARAGIELPCLLSGCCGMDQNALAYLFGGIGAGTVGFAFLYK
jgi:hypothetical protein